MHFQVEYDLVSFTFFSFCRWFFPCRRGMKLLRKWKDHGKSVQVHPVALRPRLALGHGLVLLTPERGG